MTLARRFQLHTVAFLRCLVLLYVADQGCNQLLVHAQLCNAIGEGQPGLAADKAAFVLCLTDGLC